MKCPKCGKKLVKHPSWGYAVCLNGDCSMHPLNNWKGDASWG